MKICLVTTFPPSTGGLSEYGFHIAQELQRTPSLSLTVLADQVPTGSAELDGFSVVRCWSYDRPESVVHLLRTVRRLKPDVVWFNLLFGTFGRSPVVAFSGLMTPMLTRLSGSYTHVTLHHLMDTVDLKDAGIRYEWLYRFAGAVATRGVLLSNSVSVLLPRYRKILKEKYGRDNVHLRSHGILTHRPEQPEFSRRGNPIHRILAFGKWGTYKRLELMIEAFQRIHREVPNTKLIVGGGDHPQAKGYVDSIKRRNHGNPHIEFRGYIPEDELRDLFQSATVAVMPYSSSTGCSGVAHLACAYSVPIVCSDLPDFQQMAQSEELAIEFFPAGDAEGLAGCLIELLGNSSKQWGMAIQNFSAGLRMTMPNVVQKYVRHFQLAQRTQAIRAVSRLRRLPRWLRFNPLQRLLIRNFPGWGGNSSIAANLAIASSLDSDGDAGGHLNGPGRALDRNVVDAASRGEIPRAVSPARSSEDGRHAQQANPRQSANLFSLPRVTDEEETGNQPRRGEKKTESSRWAGFGQRRSTRDSKNGTHGD